MDSLAVEFNTAVASGDAGVLAESAAGSGLAVRVGTEKMLPGSYTLVISGEGSRNGTCNPSPTTVCVMQPGLVSSSQQTMLAGKMVYELVDPSKPASKAVSVAELPINNLALLDGSTQLLLNTTDDQPQDKAVLLGEPFASQHTVASNVYNASDNKPSGLYGRDIPSRTLMERSRKTRRPKKPVRNITLNVGHDKEDENHSELLQTTPLIWIFAALAIGIVA
ncbi:hypothetical protein CFE70_007488 [Pyrenophora teres f. teres 0-1]|uniref:Uncharacterized protein n=2 Tax=Pyrenophora teres f. teres TaxID=97479 RepID=E3RFI5_PYRTT|nr:hypothetical protein PTT_06473 [Pyrenophora teres f. teres 0-1]KAK1912167.1 hypothetical protein P3342_009766 [Pyrenophora teres f. teres]